MTQEAGAPRKIVVGVDGSPSAETALRWAIDYAKKLPAEVVAVHAYERPVYYADPYSVALPATFDPELREGVRRRFVEDWCAPLTTAGIAYRTVVADGGAADVLTDVADREAAELIVTGRRGLNTLGELALGSVSHHVVHRTKRPVVLVSSEHRSAA